MIRFKCPKCGKAVSVDESAAGKLGRCPGCDASIKVPSRDEPILPTLPAVIPTAVERSKVMPKPPTMLENAKPAVPVYVTPPIRPPLPVAQPVRPEATYSGPPPWVSARPPQEVVPAPSTVACPFCGEDIKAQAKKCKHCGEMLDPVLRTASQSHYPQPPAVAPVVNVSTVVQNSHVQQVGFPFRAVPRWNRFVAAFLSFMIPGLGQCYKGQIVNGVVWFVVVVIGYLALIVPGLVLHACCIIGAAMGDTYR